ncbi:MAG: hypothetical protein HQM11_13950 [SAR324 cluster bacterium]|nr:hypothetical protein [SAR324 cluster bacterium]
MSQPFDVTCVVPRNGRILMNFLNKLKLLGAPASEIEAIIDVLKKSKAQSGNDLGALQKFLVESHNEAPACFSIFIDRKREQRPYRVGFLGYDWAIGDIHLRVEGEEPHNGSSLIKLDEVDFAVVGLDELLAMTQYYLNNPTSVTKWGMYNYNVDKPTGIRVAGSANLTSFNKSLQMDVQDMVGFFLISRNSRRRSGKAEASGLKYDLEYLSRAGQRVFVKGRYTGIVTAAYPGLKLISVENVEDSVLNSEKGSVGIEIVQSGNTLREKELFMHGKPLFLSESLYVVDYDRYNHSEALRRLIKYLKPSGYFEETRIEHFARWYYALEKNLGDRWVDRPAIEDLFCEPGDIENGLRPYRLKTRYWKPDDKYQQDAARQLAFESKHQVRQHYEALVSRGA